MPQTNHTPKDLATAVCSELKRRKAVCPKLGVLINLFETMYYASLKTEESQQISFDLVYIDPNNPDPEPPQRITNERWMVIQLSESVPLTIPNLIKIAQASDPRTSSFAVYHDESDHLIVWGFVDQASTYIDYVNYESETEVDRPGVFQAGIAGIGNLIVFIGIMKIAELKVNALITGMSDVLRGGPVHNALMPGITAHLEAVKLAVPEKQLKNVSHMEARLISDWLEALSRLLLRIQRFRHGGAILITPDSSLSGLNIKYELPYDRLKSSLANQSSSRIEFKYSSHKIRNKYLNKNAIAIPVDDYLAESISGRNLDASRRELEGAIWFLSLLTRVDGLVLFNQSMELHGFGVEITARDEPAGVFIAGNCDATDGLRSIDYNHYGTRHRSMMRYCSQVLGSVGFVISQDGDVRAITQVQGQLIMWENIKLQLPDFVHSKRATR